MRIKCFAYIFVIQIYVVDSSDKQRLEETGIELEQLIAEEKLSCVPMIVFANKQDLLNSLPVDEISEAMGLTSIKDRAWSIQPCSAKKGFGLQEGMEWVIEQVSQKEGE